MCVVIPFILDVRLMDVPAGFTQEEGHTGFLHLPFAVPALIFLARRIQPSLFLVDREVEFCVPVLGMIYFYLFLCGKISLRTTAPRFELTSQRQKVSRLRMYMYEEGQIGLLQVSYKLRRDVFRSVVQVSYVLPI